MQTTPTPKPIDILLSVPVPGLITWNPPQLPDLGLGYLAAAARRAGHSVRVIDWVPAIGVDAYRASLLKWSPRVVGIKAFTINIREVIETIRIVRETLPDAILVVGGPHPSTSRPDTFFSDFPEADFGFRGECESSLVNFLDRVLVEPGEAGSFRSQARLVDDWTGVAGLVWRDARGRAHHLEPAIEPLPDIPLPAWDLINPNNSLHPPMDRSPSRNPRVAPLIATRGCPFACTFCCAHLINGKSPRRRPVADVAAEMDLLHDTFGISQFTFTDSSFLLDTDWIGEFCGTLASSSRPHLWECIYEVQRDLPETEAAELFRAMHAAGCRRIGFSPESAAPRVIQSIKKNFNPDALRPTVAAAKASGLDTVGFFLLGFPDESLAEMRQTVRFALDNPFDTVFISLVLPLPGTCIHEEIERRLGPHAINWKTFDFRRPSVQASAVGNPVLFREHALANFKACLRAGARRMPTRQTLAWLAKSLAWSLASALPQARRVAPRRTSAS